MKPLPHLLLLLFIFSSCQKDLPDTSYKPTAIQSYLQQEMIARDYAQLDFTTMVVNRYDSTTSTVKIYFSNSTTFVALHCINATPVNGKIISLSGTNDGQHFNGAIIISSLDRKITLPSKIENGFVTAFRPAPFGQPVPSTIHPPPPVYAELPEVLIIAQYPPTGIQFTTWISLFPLLDYDPAGSGNTNGGWGGWYEQYPYSGSTGGGAPVVPPPNPILPAEEIPLHIDIENQYAEDPIDILAYLKCFTDMPDAGATASITIFTDIPVNGDAGKFFDFQSGSPGHTFIQLSKMNNGQLVSQNIGFYPKTDWKAALTTAPTEAKFVNNAEHEFNASYQVSLTPVQLQYAINKIISIRTMQYDIDDNNCTDFAVNVFNAAVDTPLEIDIPRYHIPGGMAPYGTSTPQGVYIKLKQLYTSGGGASTNITIPLLGWAGNSHGPCN